MPKRQPKPHSCQFCAALLLDFHHVDKVRASQLNLTLWNDFASPDDSLKIAESPELREYLLEQLQSFVWFHKTTFREIIDCVNSGCAFFKYVLDRISPTLERFKKSGNYVAETMDDYKPFASLLSPGRGPVDSPEENICIFIEPQPGEQSSTFRFRWFVSPYRPFHALHFEAPESRRGCHISVDRVDIDPFQVMVNPSSKFGGHMPRSINHEPGSIKALNNMKRWLWEKLEEDYTIPEAPPTGSRVMPSRLLKVDVDINGNPSKLCLVETEAMAEPVPYAALSYCWGGPQETQLKIATQSEFQEGLLVDNLPSTLKDAAVVTAHFGISYLWIDALCIIQDDPQSKGKELAKMAGIYENAMVTIVASRAKSVDEGFLKERLPFKDTAEPGFVLVGIDSVDMSTRKFDVKPILVFPVADLVGYTSPNPLLRETRADGIAINPIISRAWTFQERALSTKIIEFGRYGTVSRARNLRTGKITIIADGWRYDRSQRLPSLSMAMQKPGTPALQEWQAIVENFSLLSLSFSSDRLPAISAFAQFFSPAFGGAESYAAGLWKSTFPFSLLWYACLPNKKFINDRIIDGLPDEYTTVPSWSWASLTSAIRYTFEFSEKDMRADQGAEVIDCNVQLKSPEVPFGEVVGGELKMRGRLRPVRLSPEERPELDSPYMTRSQPEMRYLRAIISQYPRPAEKTGLHRREYHHEKDSFRDLRLPIMVRTDRDYAATQTMIGDCSALFALPIASGLQLVTRSKTTSERARYGLLLLKRSDGVYTRVASFETNSFDLETILRNTLIEEDEFMEWYRDQKAWLDAGSIEEFSIV